MSSPIRTHPRAGSLPSPCCILPLHCGEAPATPMELESVRVKSLAQIQVACAVPTTQALSLAPGSTHYLPRTAHPWDSPPASPAPFHFSPSFLCPPPPYQAPPPAEFGHGVFAYLGWHSVLLWPVASLCQSSRLPGWHKHALRPIGENTVPGGGTYIGPA